MMFAENQKISVRQLQVLLLLDCFGTAVLFLPAELAQISGRACWMAALVGGLAFALFSLLLTSVGQKYPDGTAAEWCRDAFGNIFGTMILVGLAAKFLFDGALELRIFSEIVCRAMLPDTPLWVISLVVLGVAGSLAAQGVECRGRAAEVLFFVVAVPLVVILAAVAVSSEYGRILPLALPDFSEMKDGVFAMSMVFQGLTFLYFVFPALEKPQKVGKAVFVSSFVTAAAVTVILFLCLSVYGESVLSEKLLPTLQMMERVSFTGVFLTRQDVLLLWFWMASVMVFLSGILFYGSLLGVKLFRQQEKSRKTWLLGWLVVVFAASFLPENLSAAHGLRVTFAPWFHLAYLFLLPLGLLFLMKRGGEKCER